MLPDQTPRIIQNYKYEIKRDHVYIQRLDKSLVKTLHKGLKYLFRFLLISSCSGVSMTSSRRIMYLDFRT